MVNYIRPWNKCTFILFFHIFNNQNNRKATQINNFIEFLLSLRYLLKNNTNRSNNNIHHRRKRDIYAKIVPSGYLNFNY